MCLCVDPEFRGVHLEPVHEVFEEHTAHEEPKDGAEGHHAVHEPNVHARSVPAI